MKLSLASLDARTRIPSRSRIRENSDARHILNSHEFSYKPSGYKRSGCKRSGYTLLEMILALAIGLVLLAGLYLALSTQVRQTQAAREIVEDGTLARAILTRISGDILGHLGPVDPRVLPDRAADASGSNASESPPAQSTASSGSTSGEKDAADSSAGQPSQAPLAPSDAPVTFNIGVYGDASHVMLAASRVPRELNLTGALGAGVKAQLASDLRRVSYWVASDGGQTLGLARQEMIRVTAQDVEALPWETGDAQALIIAPEVKSIGFQYFDGSAWQDQWDGNGNGSSGLLDEIPIGPPSAIAINLELRRFITENGERKERVTSYRHVVYLPAGNNYSQKSQ